jgi:hypothetical protein
MSYKTFLRFVHKADIHARTVAVNDAGQKIATFALTQNIPLYFQSNATERRLVPYVADIDEFQFYIPWQYNSIITYKNRIFNVKDRYGNILEAGPLEITEIGKKTGFGGKLHHILITARRVVENA